MRIKSVIHTLVDYGVLLATGGVMIIVLINALTIMVGYPRMRATVNGLNPQPLGLVLGAGISEEGAMSPYLKDRADAAIELYHHGFIENISVSGDNSRLHYNEVEPVKNYFLDQGVFSGDIYLDHAGFDTYDSVIRARDIFQSDQVIIISQSFHLPRAIFIARMLGIDAQGYATARYNGSTANRIREIAARVKSFAELVISASPRYGGPKIHIE